MTDYIEILLNSKYAVIGIIGFFISSLAYIIRVIWRVVKEYKIINLINNDRDVVIGKQGEISVTNLHRKDIEDRNLKDS